MWYRGILFIEGQVWVVTTNAVLLYRPSISVCKLLLFFIFVVASVGVRWMIGVTEINKGSTYGNNDNKQKQK